MDESVDLEEQLLPPENGNKDTRTTTMATTTEDIMENAKRTRPPDKDYRSWLIQQHEGEEDEQSSESDDDDDEHRNCGDVLLWVLLILGSLVVAVYVILKGMIPVLKVDPVLLLLAGLFLPAVMGFVYVVRAVYHNYQQWVDCEMRRRSSIYHPRPTPLLPDRRRDEDVQT